MRLLRHTLIAVSLLLAACGWHLKGALDVPDNFTALKISGASGALADELHAQLAANGIDTRPAGDARFYTLALGREINERRTAALGADAVVAEYEYLKAIQFELRDPENRLIGKPTSAEITRSVGYNANSVLSSTGEGTLVQTEMTRDLAAQIIRRLSFMIEQTPDGQTAR